MNLDLLALISLGLAAIPMALFLINLLVYRRIAHSQMPVADRSSMSVLIPVRNEETNIRATLESILASTDAEFEILVLDDHSTDRTAAIVSEFVARTDRVRLESAPPLPVGWCGKQHACHVLAKHARHPLLVFMDADVRLAPDALKRMNQFMSRSKAALASGVPRQELGTFSERLLLPLIHFMLLGFLPMCAMRRTRWPAMSAGCGQLFIARRDAYEQCGGHAMLPDSLHDGIKLPRVFRRAGFGTDLFDATDLATCRMYATNRETWNGLGKNATEGLAAPGTILPMTALLLGGQVLPVLLIALAPQLSTMALKLSVIAAICAFIPRLIAVRRFDQPLGAALLHPLGILALLTIQWLALAKKIAGQPMEWKGRAYAPGSMHGRGIATRATVLLLSLMALTFPVCAADGNPLSATSTNLVCPSFQLHDQFNVLHEFSFPRTNLLILTIADKEGHEQVDGWVQPLKAQFADRIAIAGIADVRGVPGFLRNSIRERFRKVRTHPVMMDWGGAVIKLLPVEKRRANVFVLSPSGVVLFRTGGEANPNAVKTLLATIEQATHRDRAAKQEQKIVDLSTERPEGKPAEKK